MIFALLDHSPKLYIHIYVYIYRYTQICPWSLQNYCAGHLVWKDSTQWSCIHGLLYYSQLSRQQDHGWLIIIGYTPGSIEIVNQATIWLPIHQPICYCTGCIDHWLVDVLFFTPLFQVIFKIPKNGKNNPRIFDGIWIDILQIVVTYNAIEATKEWTIYHHADLKTGEYFFFFMVRLVFFKPRRIGHLIHPIWGVDFPDRAGESEGHGPVTLDVRAASGSLPHRDTMVM